jgi:hypothetical protein
MSSFSFPTLGGDKQAAEQKLPLTARSTVTHATSRAPPPPAKTAETDQAEPSGAVDGNDDQGTTSREKRAPVEKAASQVEFIRSLAAAISESGVPPPPLRRDITVAELKLHNSKTDAWMALKGKVGGLSLSEIASCAPRALFMHPNGWA